VLTLYFSQSDDGATWSAPIALPTDGATRWFSHFGFAFDGTGKTTLVSSIDTSAPTTGEAFGRPKILTSSDGVTFVVSGPAKTGSVGNTKYVQGAFDGAGKLQAAFVEDDLTSPKPGIVYWRAP